MAGRMTKYCAGTLLYNRFTMTSEISFQNSICARSMRQPHAAKDDCMKRAYVHTSEVSPNPEPEPEHLRRKPDQTEHLRRPLRKHPANYNPRRPDLWNLDVAYPFHSSSLLPQPADKADSYSKFQRKEHRETCALQQRLLRSIWQH